MRNEALHIANGIINAQVSLAFAVLAGLAVALCLTRARRDLDDRLIPMAGLVAAFVFAAQMLNFPVGPGVSGHLLGGALAAILVGPWVGALCVTVVLVVQALIFSDGGLSALGLNVTNMALVGTAAAYFVVAGLLRVLPRTPGGLAVAAFLGSVIATVAASQAFMFQFFLGGDVALSGTTFGAMALSMAGIHLLIGVGEGVIAALTVGAVAKARPDLVFALRGLRRPPAAAPAMAGGVA
ncbi:energy-coupling factor ABC transporter permease [Pilimelia columellifera]|uniref:Cobalamin biosynthesis protein CbiM n=1 Tax=Pilimelia columellifera subsp. columellifera TaxID=706583 RepID=A0ABP6AUB4_9ACTN